MIAKETMLRGLNTQQQELKKQKWLNSSLEIENAQLKRELKAAEALGEMYRLRLAKYEGESK